MFLSEQIPLFSKKSVHQIGTDAKPGTGPFFEPLGSRKENVMKQEIVANTPQPTPQPQPKKVKRRETTHAGKLGDWQRLLAPIDANSADLVHLEVPRAKLASLLSQAVDLKKQQTARRAAKQDSSKQLQEMVVDGERLASLLRQALKQHYGPRSEKLAEFGLQPFRGRTKSAKTTPPPAPAPAPEVTSTVPTAAPKVSSDPTSHS
jgi:hypothetical protein